MDSPGSTGTASERAQAAQNRVHDRVSGERVLAAAEHVSERDLAAAAGPQDRDVARAKRVGEAELALERASGQLHLRREPGGTGLAEQREGAGWRIGRRTTTVTIAIRGAGRGRLIRDEQVHRREGARARGNATREQDALDSRCPADAGGRGTAELLHQTVVATTAADTALRAERIGGELEHRARVVVQATHERVIELVGDTGGVQTGANLGEVLGVPRAEEVAQQRRGPHHAASAGMLGVERAQRVELDARPHVLGEGVGVLAQVSLQLLAILLTGGEAPQARETQAHGGDTHLIQQGSEQADRLGVDRGILRAERLCAHLPELAIAPGLGALVAEEARQVPETYGLAELVHAVLDVGATDGSGALGTQSQRASGGVLEGVHLLADDVGGSPDPAREQLGRLEDGRLDALIAGALEDRTRSGLQDGAR